MISMDDWTEPYQVLSELEFSDFGMSSSFISIEQGLDVMIDYDDDQVDGPLDIKTTYDFGTKINDELSKQKWDNLPSIVLNISGGLFGELGKNLYVNFGQINY